jgi:hypothetical protein
MRRLTMQLMCILIVLTGVAMGQAKKAPVEYHTVFHRSRVTARQPFAQRRPSSARTRLRHRPTRERCDTPQEGRVSVRSYIPNTLKPGRPVSAC